MKKTITWLAWTSISLVAAVAALNWPSLLATSPINLVLPEVHLPLALPMLALVAVPLAFFFVACLYWQISTLMATRGLLRDLQRAHGLADNAEASRVDGLRQLLTDQCRAINERTPGQFWRRAGGQCGLAVEGERSAADSFRALEGLTTR